MSEAEYLESRYMFARHLPGVSGDEFNELTVEQVDVLVEHLMQEMDAQARAWDPKRRH